MDSTVTGRCIIQGTVQLPVLCLLACSSHVQHGGLLNYYFVILLLNNIPTEQASLFITVLWSKEERAYYLP